MSKRIAVFRNVEIGKLKVTGFFNSIKVWRDGSDVYIRGIFKDVKILSFPAEPHVECLSLYMVLKPKIYNRIVPDRYVLYSDNLSHEKRTEDELSFIPKRSNYIGLAFERHDWCNPPKLTIIADPYLGLSYWSDENEGITFNKISTRPQHSDASKLQKEKLRIEKKVEQVCTSKIPRPQKCTSTTQVLSINF